MTEVLLTVQQSCSSSDTSFPSLRYSDLVSVSSGFPPISKRDAPSHHTTLDYVHTGWDGLFDDLRAVPMEVISDLHAFVAASKFCMLVQAGLVIHIYHCKCHPKPYSSLWFFHSYGAAIHLCNYFFSLFQQNLSSVSEGKFRQAGNHYKIVLEARKLAYANKTYKSRYTQTLGSCEFWWLLIVSSAKLKLLFHLYLIVPRPWSVITMHFFWYQDARC